MSKTTVFLFSVLVALSGAWAVGPVCQGLHTGSVLPEKALFSDKAEDSAAIRLYLMKNETREIRAAYYQLDGNKTGKIFFSGLIAAAKRGVKTRLLLDGWNPEDWIDQRVTPEMYKALIEAGVEVRIFNYVDLKSLLTYLNPQSFHRMHDKLMICSGLNTVTTGDRNIQNSNYRIQQRKGMKGLSYRSVEMVVQSRQMTEESSDYFDKMWELGTVPDTSRVTDFELASVQKALENTYKVISSKEISNMDWTSRLQDVKNIQFLHDVPGRKAKESGIAEGLLDVLGSAQKEIVIYAPYTFFSERFMDMVKAALGRGVKIRLVLPAWKSIDTPFTLQHFESQARKLQGMGVKILQHNGSDFMHAKMAIVDGEKVFVGSYNFNTRSEMTDYETGFVVTDKEFTSGVIEFDRTFVQIESAPFTESKKSYMTTLKILFLRFLTSWIPFIRHQI